MSAVGDEMPGHARQRQVIAGVLVPRGVRAGTDAGRQRQWPSPNFLRPKSDGPHFGLREKWRRSGLLTGHIFRLPDDDYKPCLSPACDLVPGQKSGAGFHKRLGDWMPFTAVSLSKVPEVESLRTCLRFDSRDSDTEKGR